MTGKSIACYPTEIRHHIKPLVPKQRKTRRVDDYASVIHEHTGIATQRFERSCGRREEQVGKSTKIVGKKRIFCV